MIKNIIENTSSIWTEGTGQFPEIVLSSRIRLARNLTQFPFPRQQTETSGNGVLERVDQAISKDASLKLYRLNDIPELERNVLMEKHLISPEQVDNPLNKGLVLNENGSISIMVNEEDHLRNQCFEPGLELEGLWKKANDLDDKLEENLDFAFDENYGYLTCCPTNLGTGMRVSVMMHLPGLVLTNQSKKILGQLPTVGLAVRGIFGEGSESLGNLYQISNQLTLGRSEEDILLNVLDISKKLVNQEIAAREYLLENVGIKIEDRARRAFGILTNAKMITSKEALGLISNLRLGQTLGLIDLDLKKVNELFLLCQPAFLQVLNGTELNPDERDIKRAEMIKKKLS